MSQVDVIVPCYNYAHYLRSCVKSILMQEGVDVRVLILDDASPDDTPQVAAELMAQDRRVLYRRHASNQGHIATFNEGIEWASASYLVLLSADDVLVPNSLFRACDLMETHQNVGLVYGRAIHTESPESEDCEYFQRYHRRVMTGAEFLKVSCIDAINLVPTPTAVVRTSLQKVIGGYRRDLPHTADMEMWLRFAVHGNVGSVDAVQALYRVHASNMSKGYVGCTDLEARWDAFKSCFEEFGHRIEDVESLEQIARVTLLQAVFEIAYRLSNSGASDQATDAFLLAARLAPKSWRRVWFRYRCKQRLGPRAVTLLSPLVKTVNGARAFFGESPRCQSYPIA